MRSTIASLVMTCVCALVFASGCGPSYPNCEEDNDCHEGEFCVNGRCQMCRDSTDCPAGQSCNEGRCDAIPGYCDSVDDCPAGQECTGNRCVAPAQAISELPDETSPTPAACQLQPVYFAFDADALDVAARSAAQQNVECLRQRGTSAVHLTGHCDPRGTEEYNLALGDRRAKALQRYMSSLGVAASGLTTSSMGEEMARGTDESSWSRDRRSDLQAR